MKNWKRKDKKQINFPPIKSRNVMEKDERPTVVCVALAGKF
jgi:hypothetical protein